MPEFVFEIGVEEMPARFLPGLSEEVRRLLDQEFIDAKIDFGRAFVYATPRRITAHMTDVAKVQRSEEQEITGPPAKIAYDGDGNPTKAALGFAKGQGAEFSDVYTVDTDKGVYLALKKRVGGEPTLSILPEICLRTLGALSFPKKMRWGSRDFTFGRPIRWLLALLGEEVVSFTAAEIASGRQCFGHRVMGPGPFDVARAEDYFGAVRDQGSVVIDPAERESVVRRTGDELAGEKGGRIVWNDRLMGEVVNLVEYPRPILGTFDASFLELPREVLLTSMESHQKSFGVEDGKGGLLPHFLTVLNLDPKDVELVRKGWERVLRARLEDARFFWKTDTAGDFDTWLRRLDNVTFMAGLGSMGDKANRLAAMCSWLAETIRPELLLDLSQAGRLAKCDLVSEMVGEFADLQGIMGGIYARKKGYSETIAEALYEQYLPTGHKSPVPSTPAGALLAVADKIDNLAGCFGLGRIPTGGADPYALRRQALGICRIVLEHELNLDLGALVEKAFAGYPESVDWKLPPQEGAARLMEFFGQRLKALFTSRGFETLVVEACLAAGFTDVRTFAGRVEALDGFSRRPDFESSVLTFKRAANIIRKQAGESGPALTGQYDPKVFASEHETFLAETMERVAPRFEAHWQAGEYDRLMDLLAEIKPAVDGFFDNVMVMCDEEDVRVNRLNLLQSLVAMLSRLADFNALQV